MNDFKINELYKLATKLEKHKDTCVQELSLAVKEMLDYHNNSPKYAMWWHDTNDTKFKGNLVLVDTEWFQYIQKSDFISYKYLYELPTSNDDVNSLMYEKGWIEATKWADRDDLVSDIGSPAYLNDMHISIQGK